MFQQTSTAFAEYFRLWRINIQYNNTEIGTQNCLGSIRSRTMGASAREWSKPSTIFSESAQRKKEDYSVALSGCLLKHPQELLERT